MSHDLIYNQALEQECKPIWADGIFGKAWHCGCDNMRHGLDSQCSMITEKSLKENK